MGLVNRVVADEDVASYCEDYARMIAANAPMTVNSIKFITNQTRLDEASRDMQKCDRLVKDCFESRDYVEGRRAFMEKRKPEFVGA